MSARWNPFVKQVAVVGSIVAVVWLLAHIRGLIIPVILALLLAYLASFPTAWLIRHTGWPRTPVVTLIYLIVILILVIAPVLFVPRLAGLFRSLGVTLINSIRELSEATPKPVELLPGVSIDLGPFYAPLNQWVNSVVLPDPEGTFFFPSFLFPLGGRAVFVVRSALTSVVWTVFILAVSFYVVKDAPSMGRWIASRVPESLQAELGRLWRELTLIWDAYIRGQIILGLIMGVLTWFITGILGVRNAAALGFMYFLAEFVPGVGHVISAMVGIALALLVGSSWLPMPHLWFAVVVTITYILLAQFENIYLLPRIIGGHVALHPVVVMVGALAGAELGGVLGILLAAPVIASARVIFRYTMHKILDEDPFPPPLPPGPEADLYWRGLLRDHPVAAVLFDLDGTLIQVDSALVARLARRLEPLRRWLPRLEPDEAARRLVMTADLNVNRAISTLNSLGLRGVLAKLNNPLNGLRGYCLPCDYKLVPGSEEALRSLARTYPLGIITGRSAPDTADFLARFGLPDLFSAVITRDDVRQLKPHPAPLNLAARRLGLPPNLCVVVGDTPFDVRMAKAARALSVGVLSGYGSAKDLSSADLVIDSVVDLARWLRPTSKERAPDWDALTTPADLEV